jgi:hypothetical protein
MIQFLQESLKNNFSASNQNSTQTNFFRATSLLSKTFMAFVMVLFTNISWGQGLESFTNLPTNSSSSYLSRSWTGDDNVTWTAERARTDQTLTSKAICFATSGTRYVTSPIYAGGMGVLSFNYVRGFTGTAARSIEVYVNNIQIGSTITVSNTSNTVINYSQSINISGNVNLEIRSLGAGQVKIDDISWTAFSSGGSINGCTDATACNYNAAANSNDGSCIFAAANADCGGNCLTGYTSVNGSCVAIVTGCMDATACNYNDAANTNDSCIFQGQAPTVACNEIATWNTSTCQYDITVASTKSSVDGGLTYGTAINTQQVGSPIYWQYTGSGFDSFEYSWDNGATAWNTNFSTNNPANWGTNETIGAGGTLSIRAKVECESNTYYSNTVQTDWLYNYGGNGNAPTSGITASLSGTPSVLANGGDMRIDQTISWSKPTTSFQQDNYAWEYEWNNSDSWSGDWQIGTNPAIWSDNTGTYVSSGDAVLTLRTRHYGTGVDSYSSEFSVTLRKPVITTAGSLSPFVYCSGTASAYQSFTISGSYLGSDLAVTAPSGFELCTTSCGSYTSSLTLSPNAGALSDTIIYVRVASGNSAGSISGDISCSAVAATTVNIAVSSSSCAPMVNLFFSEYGEGSSNNKYLEIYNPTSNPVDLSAYALANVNNEPTTAGVYEFWNSFPAGAQILANDVYVIAHPSAEATILAQADHTFSFLSNGDDGFALVYGTRPCLPADPATGGYVIVDFIGDWNADPGTGWSVAGVSNATADHTLVRKCTVTEGNNNWSTSAGTNVDDSEWVVLAINDWTNLGSHTPLPPPNADCSGACLAGYTSVGGTCVAVVNGCTVSTACNYNSAANTNDNSCIYAAVNADCAGACLAGYTSVGGACVAVVNGCTVSTACNYNSAANTNDNSCTYAAVNADCAGACLAGYTSVGGACVAIVTGCTNSSASNYNQNANTDDGSCIVTPSTASLSLQLFLDGYYENGSNPSIMRAARYANLVESGSANPGAPTDVDVITVELRSASNLNAVVYSVSPILQTNGSVQCTFPQGALGNSYYIVVKHRSSLPLWSVNPITISGSTALNFANNITNAYTVGSVAPMKTLTSGLYASRLGELNEDGYLDGVDYTLFEIDNNLSQYGGLYLLDGDFNGDTYVDASDFSVFDFNTSLGSFEQRPY